MAEKKCIHIRAVLDPTGLLSCKECGMQNMYPVGEAVTLEWIEYVARDRSRIVYGKQVIYPK